MELRLERRMSADTLKALACSAALFGLYLAGCWMVIP